MQNAIHMPPTPNQITSEADEFYVSFNSRDWRIYGGDTTALVWGQMQKFYILNGDHTAAYKTLEGQGWEAHLAYFRENYDQINKLSDKLDDLEVETAA
ncbi:hypothetical protein [Erythrobacter aureus]|uniref:hypothetical protein n=1 Tax=Erythrobacter aureus TaxID=2182384 RepID=UPI001F3CBDAA|nr:hypothetical protein [Erythrobacter aureus]